MEIPLLFSCLKIINTYSYNKVTEQRPTTLCGNTTTEYIFNFVPQNSGCPGNFTTY